MKKKQIKTPETQENEQWKRSKVAKDYALVKDKEQKVHIVLGKYAVSEKAFNSFDDAELYLQMKPYEVILNSISAIIKLHADYEKNKGNQEANQ